MIDNAPLFRKKIEELKFFTGVAIEEVRRLEREVEDLDKQKIPIREQIERNKGWIDSYQNKIRQLEYAIQHPEKVRVDGRWLALDEEGLAALRAENYDEEDYYEADEHSFDDGE